MNWVNQPEQISLAVLGGLLTVFALWQIARGASSYLAAKRSPNTRRGRMSGARAFRYTSRGVIASALLMLATSVFASTEPSTLLVSLAIVAGTAVGASSAALLAFTIRADKEGWIEH